MLLLTFQKLVNSLLYCNENNLVREKWQEKVLISWGSCSFFSWEFLRIFKDSFFSLLWSSSESVLGEINFSVGSGTIIFLFVVWMGVLFKVKTNFENSLIYWNQNNITRQKWWGKVLSLVWNENLVFYIFSTYTGKSNLESYIFISFVKLMENNFIEFLSWNQWKMISFNDKDLIGRLFMTTSQRFVLNQ